MSRYYQILGQGATVGEGPQPVLVHGPDALPGQVIIADSNSDGYWGTISGGGSFTAGGDLTGTNIYQIVVGIQQASVPAGPYTIGNVLQVQAPEQLYYAPVDLSGGSNYIQGVLPPGNCPIATNISMGILELSGDFGGSASGPEVVGIDGYSVLPLSDGYLFYSGSNMSWQTITVPTNAITQLTGDVIAGPGSGSQVATVVALQGHPVSTAAPSINNSLEWNGSLWALTTLSISGDVSGALSSSTFFSTVQALQGHPVSNTSPSTGNVLEWTGSQWTPTAGGSITLSGDVIGPTSSNTVVALQGFAVSSTGPGVGETLVYSGGAWVPGVVPLNGNVVGTSNATIVQALQNHSVSNATPSLGNLLEWNPSLGGWYPNNPTLSGDVSGTLSSTTVIGLQGFAVSSTSPSTGNVLEWTGSQWTPTAGGSITLSGDVTGPTSGNTVQGLQNHSVSNAYPAFDNVLQWNGSEWVPAGLPPYPTLANIVGNAFYISSDYTVAQGVDYYIFTQYPAGPPITISLSASPVNGETYYIKDADGAAPFSSTTVDGVGNNIDGAPTYVITEAFACVQFTWCVNGWYVMGTYNGTIL